MEHTLQEVYEMLLEMKGQIARLVSDAHSEKDVRKRIIGDQEKRIRELEDYKNTLEGERQVLKVLVGILCTVVAGLIIWLFTKK